MNNATEFYEVLMRNHITPKQWLRRPEIILFVKQNNLTYNINKKGIVYLDDQLFVEYKKFLVATHVDKENKTEALQDYSQIPKEYTYNLDAIYEKYIKDFSITGQEYLHKLLVEQITGLDFEEVQKELKGVMRINWYSMSISSRIISASIINQLQVYLKRKHPNKKLFNDEDIKQAVDENMRKPHRRSDPKFYFAKEYDRYRLNMSDESRKYFTENPTFSPSSGQYYKTIFVSEKTLVALRMLNYGRGRSDFKLRMIYAGEDENYNFIKSLYYDGNKYKNYKRYAK